MIFLSILKSTPDSVHAIVTVIPLGLGLTLLVSPVLSEPAAIASLQVCLGHRVILVGSKEGGCASHVGAGDKEG